MLPVEQALVSIEEYLNTSYDGADRGYVDGRIVERNSGEKDQGLVGVSGLALPGSCTLGRRHFG
jgi:hypothetical protein